MGIVYEAVQESLGRQVALKVLPARAGVRGNALERFRREARAAAHLHHTNIVPVFGVGEADGDHYYAMQFIPGQGLDAVLEELRRLRDQPQPPPAADSDPGMTVSLAANLASGQFPAPAADSGLPADPAAATRSGPAGSTVLSGSSDLAGGPDAAYFRTVARLGTQVADALAYAHAQGVVHRDVKPSNLLLDAHGTLWVTDFGLAKVEGTDELTIPGDVVGTVRYMAPERFAGKADARSDVYGLGLTLYELLTLRPGYDDPDRMKLIDRIRTADPPRPRSIDPRIPRDLELIVRRAIARHPADRYATAGELADDLGRFLRDEAVRARRPTLFLRARKWARRNRTAVTTGVLGLAVALAVLAGSVGWAVRDRAARQMALDQAAAGALDEAATWYGQENRTAALAAVKRADVLLASGGGNEDLRQRAHRWRADLDMVEQLEGIRLQQAELEGDYFRHAGADPAYAAAFRDYGLDVPTVDPGVAAARIRASTIRAHLVAALDDWMIWVKPREDAAGRGHLRAIARLADPDDWRNRFRDLAEQRNRRDLEQFADRPEVADQSPTSAVLLARALQSVGAVHKSLTVLSAAQQRHPNDFWLNVEVGAVLLWKMRPPRGPQAAGYFRAALALRPDNAGVYCNLAGALREPPEDLDQAIAAYRKAVELNRNYASAYFGLAEVYGRQGAWGEAVRACREAVRINPDSYQSHHNLGVALYMNGSVDEAIAEYREAVRLKPDDPQVRANLAVALMANGLLDEAITEFRRAISLRRDFSKAHRELAVALHGRGLLDEALAANREAIRLNSDDALAHTNLGVTLREKGLLDEAISAHRRAIALNPKLARPHYNLGLALAAQGDREGAITEYREAIAAYSAFLESAPRDARTLNALARLFATCPAVELRDAARAVELAKKAVELAPREPNYWNTLGVAHYRAGDWGAAIAALEQAIWLRRVSDGSDWFFLAMAHWRLGDKEQARQFYDKAVQWTENNRRKSDELRRFQAEAEELLGIKGPPGPRPMKP